MSVIVAAPIHRVSAKVVYEKGRGWSAVDELVLWALSRSPASATTLAEEFGVPRRVILAIISRMMRFRLVLGVIIEGTLAFQATEYGATIVASGDEIPNRKRRLSRKVAFVVDRITGTVFAKRDVKTDTARGLDALRERGADVREVEVTGTAIKTSHRENVTRFQKVLNEDETLLHFDGDTLIEREDEYLLVIVEGDDIRGLPTRTPTRLIEQIRAVATTKNPARPIRVQSLIVEKDETHLSRSVPVTFDHADLVMGGVDHRKALETVLRDARRRVLIHSTFLRTGAMQSLIPLLRNAVRRGATIDIFWGSGTPDEPGEKTVVAATAIKKEISLDDLLRDRVRIHLRSTGSHAKLLLADNGEGGYIAIVGSCNWLYTGFDRLDLSVRLREPAAVASVVEQFCALVAKPGFRPEIGTELLFLSKNLSTRPASTGPHQVRLVVGPAHEAILREASGSRPERFLIASDKLGNSAFSNAIIPAEVAAAAARTTPVVVYGDPSGLVTGISASAMTHEARDRGVRLLYISEGFHAKFLLWGDDDIVVTSLNWGSWRTSPDFPQGEIGVHVSRRGIARDVTERLKFIWTQL